MRTSYKAGLAFIVAGFGFGFISSLLDLDHLQRMGGGLLALCAAVTIGALTLREQLAAKKAAAQIKPPEKRN
jgi:hypothetical protein